MNNNIIYQNLEEKYVESAFECLTLTQCQKGTLINDLQVDPIVLSQNSINTFKNPESYKSTIIAVDTTKHNYVCGIFLGQDLTQYVQNLRRPCSVKEMNLQKQLGLKALEPLILSNYQPGDIIVGNGHGVRVEYENQKVSQNLVKVYLQNAQNLGYSFTIGIFYNPKSAHIVSKFGGRIINRIQINQTQGISEEIRKKIKNSEIYVIGCSLLVDNSITKLLPTFPMPQL